MTFQKMRQSVVYKGMLLLQVMAFVSSGVSMPVKAYAQSVVELPAPGMMVSVSDAYVPVMLRAVKINPDQPLVFDFIVDSGNTKADQAMIKSETQKLVKYFLASLTIPENDLWVNLSPYEHDRIVPQGFGDTQMGRDLLAQDYILKQLSASMIYPEKDLGKAFWDRVYTKARETLGVNEIPMNTFNKVWIMPDQAKVYELNNTAVVGKSHLKVLMEEDYLALKNNSSDVKLGTDQLSQNEVSAASKLSSQIMREIVLPEIEKEVNTGKNFAQLRQVYQSLILATWYKNNLKEALLNQVYADKNKVAGVDVLDKTDKEQIFQRYVQAYKEGVFNYIKEEKDLATNDVMPRKYFSGGFNGEKIREIVKVGTQRVENAQAIPSGEQGSIGDMSQVTVAVKASAQRSDKAAAPIKVETLQALLKLGFPSIVNDNIHAGVVETEEQANALEIIIDINEVGLLENWDAPGINDGNKRAFLDQIYQLNDSYPNGLRQYKENVRYLLHASALGINPFAGFEPSVPVGDSVRLNDPKYNELLDIGLKQANRARFVLVAGGLGERLGYAGIKVSIPTELVTEKTYLENYIRTILEIQNASNRLNNENREIQFVIMTSDDTHEKTLRLLEDNNYFGMNGLSINPQRGEEVKQIVILKQGMVPAVNSSEASFVTKAGDPYALQVKPHGHGDVHSLVYKAGVISPESKYKLDARSSGQGDIHVLMNKAGLVDAPGGRTHTVFFQDTNGQIFNGVLVALGNSVKKQLALNFITVPREAGEKAGAIMTMTNKATGEIRTQNTEYNEITSVLPDGDVADPKTGFSPYPGNLNVFIAEDQTYAQELHKTAGVFGEFINPKYTDGTKTAFKSPTRSETMMQDYAKVLRGDKVGVTNFMDKDDVFTPVKNDIVTAAGLSVNGKRPDSMALGEADKYAYSRKLLNTAGVKVDVNGQTRTTQGVSYREGARVVLSPNFAISVQDVKDKVVRASISDKSVLLLDGANIRIEGLSLDGALLVKTASDVSLRIKNVVVRNKSWDFVDLTESEMQSKAVNAEYLRIRGYKVEKKEQVVLSIQEPGVYEYRHDGKLYRQQGADWKVYAEGSDLTQDLTSAKSDKAQDLGGIDFNPAALNLKVERTGSGIKVQVDPAEIARIKADGVIGFTPVIINITPVKSMFPEVLGR